MDKRIKRDCRLKELYCHYKSIKTCCNVLRGTRSSVLKYIELMNKQQYEGLAFVFLGEIDTNSIDLTYSNLSKQNSEYNVRNSMYAKKEKIQPTDIDFTADEKLDGFPKKFIVVKKPTKIQLRDKSAEPQKPSNFFAERSTVLQSPQVQQSSNAFPTTSRQDSSEKMDVSVQNDNLQMIEEEGSVGDKSVKTDEVTIKLNETFDANNEGAESPLKTTFELDQTNNATRAETSNLNETFEIHSSSTEMGDESNIDSADKTEKLEIDLTTTAVSQHKTIDEKEFSNRVTLPANHLMQQSNPVLQITSSRHSNITSNDSIVEPVVLLPENLTNDSSTLQTNSLPIEGPQNDLSNVSDLTDMSNKEPINDDFCNVSGADMLFQTFQAKQPTNAMPRTPRRVSFSENLEMSVKNYNLQMIEEEHNIEDKSVRIETINETNKLNETFDGFNEDAESPLNATRKRSVYTESQSSLKKFKSSVDADKTNIISVELIKVI